MYKSKIICWFEYSDLKIDFVERLKVLFNKKIGQSFLSI